MQSPYTDGTWYIDYAKNGYGGWEVVIKNRGGSGAIPVAADYDGDGDHKADLSVKDADGTWYIDYAKDGYVGWEVVVPPPGDGTTGGGTTGGGTTGGGTNCTTGRWGGVDYPIEQRFDFVDCPNKLTSTAYVLKKEGNLVFWASSHGSRLNQFYQITPTDCLYCTTTFDPSRPATYSPGAVVSNAVNGKNIPYICMIMNRGGKASAEFIVLGNCD